MIVPFRQPGVVFFPAGHRYEFIGTPVDHSVTGILREHKVSADWSTVPADVLLHARDRGLAAHAATHYFDEGTLDQATVHPHIEGYLSAWELFVRENDFDVLLLETALVHPLLRYAGTVDRFGIVHGLQREIARSLRRPSVVDIKTGEPDDAGAGPQTAAYEQLIRAVCDPLDFPGAIDPAVWDEPWTRYSVHLQPNGLYKLHTYTSHRDLQRFTWALSLEASAHKSWKGQTHAA